MLSLIRQQPFEVEPWLSITARSWLKDSSLNPLLGTTDFPYERMAQQAAHRLASYPSTQRRLLVQVLETQYRASGLEQACSGLASLAMEQGVVISTAHQPNWLGGPAYWLHKMLSTVALARSMQKICPSYTWVPLYWMGSEDHDLDELGYCEVQGQRLEWPGPRGPLAFGRLEIPDIRALVSVMGEILGNAPHTDRVMDLVNKAYLPGLSVAQATRRLAHFLLGPGGWLDEVRPGEPTLIVLDGDDPSLKALMGPVWEDQLLNPGLVASLVEQAQSDWSQRWGSTVDFQVREFPFFVLDGTQRKRVQHQSEGENLQKDGWANLSPGAALRPLYQEKVLPGVAWLGGGAEQGYWSLLRPVFARYDVPFPLCFLRPSLTLVGSEDWQFWQSMGWSADDLGDPSRKLLEAWLNQRIQDQSVPLPFWLWTEETRQSQVEDFLRSVRAAMVDNDVSMGSAVGAAEHRIQQELERLFQMHRKSFRKKHRHTLEAAEKVMERISPGGQPMERREGMWKMLADGGPEGLAEAMDWLNPVSYASDLGQPWHRTVVVGVRESR